MATLAPSLRRLFSEIDSIWPGRTRKIDGWYRDPKVGISKGHNPGARGLVHAIDVDRRGIDPDWIVSHIYHGNQILDYTIWNRVIVDYHNGWKPKAYTLSNPHTDHIHIEIFQSVAAENYGGSWLGGSVSGGDIIGGIAGTAGPGGGVQGLGAADDRDPRAYMTIVQWAGNTYGNGMLNIESYNASTMEL